MSCHLSSTPFVCKVSCHLSSTPFVCKVPRHLTSTPLVCKVSRHLTSTPFACKVSRHLTSTPFACSVSCHLSSTGVLISKACITAGAPGAWHTLLGEEAEVEATARGCSNGGHGGPAHARPSTHVQVIVLLAGCTHWTCSSLCMHDTPLL